jgi:hypothetical protein
MSVHAIAGIGFGFILEGGVCEIQEEINKHGYNFEAVQIDAEGSVLVGVHIAEGEQNEDGDELKFFEPIEEGVIAALEELRSQMDVYSEIKYAFYFYYN